MSDGPSHAASFDENDYARPNQPWECGWAASGHACPLGPTKLGLCRSAFECTPYKDRETWVCARTSTHGGTCDEGPLPDGSCCKQIQKCQPVRSVLARRGVLSFTVFAAAIALALIILGAPNRQRLVSPGPLSSQHSQVVDRCEACHAAEVESSSSWLPAFFDHEKAQQQSDQCLQCHTELGPNATRPHGQSPAVFTELRALRGEPSAEPSHRFNGEVTAAKALFSRAIGSDQELACATCHREHRGKLTDLKALTDDQCQVCHAETFRGFSGGHPAFATYPYERRTRLYFDHLSHYGEHFADVNATAQRKCGDCHHPDSAGRYMRVKNFESTCAECHSHQIHDDTTLGIAVFSLPALDVDALREKGRKIGHWPHSFPLHVEATGSVSPLQRLLLQSYDGYEAVEASLSGIDLSDLRDADSIQSQSVESLVWMLKESLYDIVRKGHPEIERRLASVLGGRVSDQQITTLANSYPLVMAIEMQEAWLPTLAEEVEARRAGGEPPTLEAAGSVDAATFLQRERRQLAALASGWYMHGSSLSLRYRPQGHADPLLKALLDISSRGLVDQSESTPAKSTPAKSTLAESTLQELFEQLSSPFVAGRCMKCHSVDREQGALPHVNWHPYEPPLGQHKFTRFSHAPHVTMLSNDACSTCHALNTTPAPATALYRTEFVDSHWHPVLNPHNFESNFAPMSNDGCAACHSDDTGRDRCLTCHNYHVH